MLKRFAVELCGIATSLLTVALVVLIERLFEVSIVGWMVWFFVPAGAILCGLVAASGYFGGALLFHRRPGPFVPISMMVVSGATFVLIYVGHFWPVHGQLSFGDSLRSAITSARSSLQPTDAEGRDARNFRVVLALLQFGGIILWSRLRGPTACEHCQRQLNLADTLPTLTS